MTELETVEQAARRTAKGCVGITGFEQEVLCVWAKRIVAIFGPRESALRQRIARLECLIPNRVLEQLDAEDSRPSA